MKEFNELCKLVEDLSPEEYAVFLAEKSAKLIPVLDEITDGSGTNGTAALATFVLASVCADGKLDEAEYLFMYPMLKIFFGENYDYEGAKASLKMLKPEVKALKKLVDKDVDLLGQIDEELKADVIAVCLLICAVDGKISLKEKNYIKQLIR